MTEEPGINAHFRFIVCCRRWQI